MIPNFDELMMRKYACVKSVGQEHWHQWCVHWLGRSISDSLVWSRSWDVSFPAFPELLWKKCEIGQISHRYCQWHVCLSTNFYITVSESLKKSCQHKICPKTNTGQNIYLKPANACLLTWFAYLHPFEDAFFGGLRILKVTGFDTL